MVFPPWFERLQIKYMNPAVRPFARFLPGTALVKHRGRTSGKPYETIVTAYRNGDLLAIALAHGKTNWVKNVLAAGGADVRLRDGNEAHITNPRILPVGSTGPDVDKLPRLVQTQLRRVGVFVGDISNP